MMNFNVENEILDIKYYQDNVFEDMKNDIEESNDTI